jgi:hypothetical protein
MKANNTRPAHQGATLHDPELGEIFVYHGEFRPVSEHWAPCAASPQIIGGRTVLSGYASWIWGDGWRVDKQLVAPGEANTPKAVLDLLFERHRLLPPPSRKLVTAAKQAIEDRNHNISTT